jgi:hypothetical protein
MSNAIRGMPETINPGLGKYTFVIELIIIAGFVVAIIFWACPEHGRNVGIAP